MCLNYTLTNTSHGSGWHGHLEDYFPLQTRGFPLPWTQLSHMLGRPISVAGTVSFEDGRGGCEFARSRRPEESCSAIMPTLIYKA